MQPFQAMRTPQRVEAADLPASAGLRRNRNVADLHGAEEGSVPPLARDAARTADDAPIDHEAAADARTEHDAEHRAVADARAAHRFGQHHAIGVVGDLHRAAESGLQFGSKPATVDTGDVGAESEVGLGVDDTRDGQAQGQASRAFVAEFGHDLAEPRPVTFETGAMPDASPGSRSSCSAALPPMSRRCS